MRDIEPIGKQREAMCETSEPTEKAIPKKLHAHLCAEIAWRLHEVFDFRPETEIARQLKVSRQAVEELMSGKEFPPTEMLLHVHAATKVSLHWILTGEGSPFPTRRVVPKNVTAEDWVSLGLA